MSNLILTFIAIALAAALLTAGSTYLNGNLIQRVQVTENTLNGFSYLAGQYNRLNIAYGAPPSVAEWNAEFSSGRAVMAKSAAPNTTYSYGFTPSTASAQGGYWLCVSETVPGALQSETVYSGLQKAAMRYIDSSQNRSTLELSQSCGGITGTIYNNPAAWPAIPPASPAITYWLTR